MKRLFITTIMLLWVAITYGQLTGTKQIPVDYPTLAAAITDLNAQGVGTGGVTIDLVAGNPETAPIGGYVITATGTLANPILIKGNGNTITSNGALASGTISDAFFKIIGGDYITIDGFVMQENAANTTTTASSNNMTEFGVALFYSSTTDGPQNCTIQNNTITLGAAYQNAFGVYATSRTNATSMTTTADITSPAGAFSNLKVLNNTISSVNLGVVLVGSATGDNMATNVEVTGNNITFGRTGTFSSYTGVSGTVYGIDMNSVLGVTVNSNTILCNGTNTGGTLRGIYHYSNGTLPTTGSFVNNYKFNTITLTNGATTPTYGIHIQNLSNLFTTYVNGNTINNLNSSVATTSSVYGIFHEGASLYQNINGNILMLNPNTTTGSVYAINGGNTIPANGTQTVQNNSIQINKSGAGATVYGYYSGSSSTATVVKNISNNTFDGIVVTGATTVYAIYDNDGTSTGAPIKNIFGNNIKNFTGGTSPIILITTNYDGNSVIHDNIIEGITNGANITGINAGGSSTSLANVYNNQIHNLTITSGSINGIVSGANATGSISNVYANTIYNLEATSATSSVTGISVTAGNTTNLYNNFIKELYTPIASSSTQPMIAGIALLNGTNSNVYYNTVYLDATSTGTDFSTCALYASTTPSVKLINNILVNNSTPNGVGMTIAIRRTESSLSKYNNASNNNCLFAGTPSANNVIYYDGTNSYEIINDLVAAVSPRETSSIRDLPPFVNIATAPYDLHIQTTIATGTESGGMVITGFDNDIDNDIRFGSTGYTGTGTSPDMGADEFNGSPNFTCGTPAPGNTIASNTSVCLDEKINLNLQNTIPGTGITYQWKKSTDGTTYTDMPAATSSVVSGYAITEPTYFVCEVTCINGPAIATSSPIFVDLTNKILTTTDGNVCGAGEASLAATATGGSTINWYDAPTEGNLVGTGSPFVTPLISSTTSYYVAAETNTPINVIIGTATTLTSATTQPTAFCNRFSQYWSQTVFTAAELHSAGLSSGNIYSISYDITTLGDGTNVLNNEIRIGTTNSSTLTNFTTTGLTLVYGPATYNHSVGVNTITFDTPYYWDGTSNIIIDVRHDGADATNNAITYYTSTTGNTTVYAVTSTSASTSELSTMNPSPSLSTQRLNVVFAATNVCSSPRVEVTATVGASTPITISDDVTVCNDAVATAQVTTGASSYTEFTWTPETDLYTDAACTTPYVAGASSNQVYMKSSVAGVYTYICAAYNSSTGCGATDTINITVLPATINLAASPASICVSGSAVLNVTPATGFGSAVFQFAESSDGTTYSDISGANGFTYTTGILNSDMHYQWTALVGTDVCIQEQLLINVTNPQVLSTTPGSNCGTGSVALSATGNAGSTLNWFDAATAGNLVGTGTDFTTPSISSTTSYYVEADIMGTPATVGNGASTSSGYESPFYHLFGGKKSQYLILASDLQAAGLTSGTINSLAFEVVSAGTTYQELNLSLGSTTASAMTTTFISGLTNVYSNPAYTPVVGTNEFLFSTPYNWDGTSNIVVEFCWSNNNGGGTGTTVKYDSKSYVSEAYYRADYETASTLCGQTTASSTMSALPKFVFTTACMSARTEVVATITTPPAVSINSSINDVCAGTAVTLTAQSTNNDYSYAWSTSDNGQMITVNPTSYTTFVVTATDANTGCVTTAETDINVYPLPVATATIDNANITCGQSVQLTAGDLYSPDVNIENFNGTTNVFTAVNTSTGGTPSAAAWTLRPDGYVYSSTTFHSNDNSQFIMSNSDAQGNGGTTHTELISPVFSSVGVDSITIEMYHYYNYYGGTAKVEVYDGTQWTTVQSWNTDQGSAANFDHVVIPLTNVYLNNANLQIRFVYDDSWGYYWAIDNAGINLYHANTLSWTSTPLGFTSAIYNPTDAPSTTTQYDVVVTSVHGCTNTASVNVTVNNPAAPTVTVNNLCGESELTASNYTGTLAWSTSESTETITVNNSNAVSVTYTDGTCTSDATTVNPVPVEIPATPTVDPVNSCYAETVSAFTATSNYNDFVWYADASLTTPIGTGSTYQSPEVNVGTYTYYVVAMNGICASDAAMAVLNINALPTVSISQNVDTLYSTSNSGNQWYNSTGIISGATDSTYTVTTEDDYYVVVTDANGCSAMSNSIHVIPTAISNNMIESMISVRPNPAHEYVVVNLGKLDNAQVQIIAADGKVVYNTNVKQNQQTISLNGFVTGLYTIKVTTNSKTIQKKLVVE